MAILPLDVFISLVPGFLPQGPLREAPALYPRSFKLTSGLCELLPCSCLEVWMGHSSTWGETRLKWLSKHHFCISLFTHTQMSRKSLYMNWLTFQKLACKLVIWIWKFIGNNIINEFIHSFTRYISAILKGKPAGNKAPLLKGCIPLSGRQITNK